MIEGYRRLITLNALVRPNVESGREDIFVLSPGSVRVLLASAVIISHISKYDIGRLGVIFFFFLSGYWTSRIWTEKFDEKQFAPFYVSRALRIYPLFLVVSLASSIFRGLPLSLENFLLFGIATTGNDPTGVSWSLDIEMQYYLLCPLLLPLLRRLPWTTLTVCSAVAAVAWIVTPALGIRTALLYLPAFLAGALSDQLRHVPSARSAHASLGLFALASVGAYFTPFFTKMTHDPFHRDIFALLWLLPLIPYLQRSLSIHSSRTDRAIGDYSYALYLAHFAVIALIVVHGTVTEKLVATIVSFGVAAILYIAVDSPLNAIRYRLLQLISKRARGS
ncbi:acyltransferase [Sphingobium sp. DEHP117]|uniref:acyltransferase family protein n=1 Tax=Sphingobium sp. DEHP117 TaxID=2993436 RepID=UPI0027D49013|nr:acyltransferase family protein [Sphingobium sp. DEHP117]MDQ4420926.1 acyltransferase [Sphingobium sp. DEHP117]